MPVLADSPSPETADSPSPETAQPPPAVVEPWTPDADAGRTEARAAFVADAGGDAPSAVTVPAPETGAPEAVAMTAAGVATMAAQLLDALGQVAGPRFVGGTAAGWALAEPERAAVASAATPLVEKYGATQLSPEALLLATLATIYLPRALAALGSGAAPP